MNYELIRRGVTSIISSRDGMSSADIVSEITGIICNRAFINGFDEDVIVEFLDLVKDHKLKEALFEKRWYDINELLSDEVYHHPMFFALEADIINYRPGKSQTGPGEFFFCFFDKGSEFSVSGTCGYDVMTMGMKAEFKKIGTNFTSDELFDDYHKKGIVENLVVVKPVSGAKRPRNRTRVMFVPIDNWRSYLVHNEEYYGKTRAGGLKAAF